MNQFVIREMGASHLDIAIKWAENEGWNPGLGDAPDFRAADPGGFLMGFLDEQPATAISAVRYGTDFGFIGLYIAAPDMRGKGYGWATWQAGMERLAGRIVGLDGVVAQQDNYRKSGFELAHRNIRYGGRPGFSRVPDERLVVIDSQLLPSTISYDHAFFPAPREDFLRAWLNPERRCSFAYVEDGTMRGYGTIRQCKSGHKIGPLFAEREDVADALFRALGAEADGEVFLDLPEPNRAALALATRNGLKPVFETARMYRGPAPGLPLDRIYGITTFELG